MSLGYNDGGFLAVIELTNKIRREFVGAPSQFKNISDKVRNLSIAIQDADIVLCECEPDATQKTDLQEITSSCYEILSDLEKTLGKYDELQNHGGNLVKKVKRVRKKLKWEPENIQELGDRIILNVTLLNTFIERISAQTTFTAEMGVDRLNERQDDEQRPDVLDWPTPITASRYNYFQIPKMTSFKYKPIALTRPAFRLLRLLKGSSDPIQCQLFDSELPPPASSEHVTDYAALSYTWGSTSKPCEILINGSKMTVTKNAYLALRDLRYQEKDRLLWIDALCINQNDDRERGEQVQQMGSIYSKAERVIIWLGEATFDIGYAMRYMEQLEKESTKHASNGLEISDKQWVNIWSAIVHCINADQRDILVEGLRSLLRRNWFKRVWIIQEVANARVAEIACSGKYVSASIFALTLSLLDIIPDPHCQPILEIMPGPLRNSSWWAKRRDLSTLLLKFRESEATDPLDSIYALLGISSDACNANFLRANYEKNLQDVIFDTALFLLDCHKLSSPIRRLFDWTLPEFLKNLNSLAHRVFECAVKAGHDELLELLMVRDDFNVNADRGVGREAWRTPLSLAAEHGHEALVKLLLEKGADLKARSISGRTALSWAAENGQGPVVKLLLDKGAKPDTQDSYYITVLSLAAAKGHEIVVKLLLEKGAKLEAKSRDGQTPLSWAAMNGHEAVVKLLLDKGAEPEAGDRSGQLPFLYAAKNGHAAVVWLLSDKMLSLRPETRLG